MTSSVGAVLRLVGVTKRYPIGRREFVTAADEVTLDVAAGASVALVGASGSGKSTLLHLIGGMDVPDEGRLEIDGTDLGTLRRAELAAYRRRVGFVFQQFHLLPALSALDNVIAPLLPLRVDFDRVARGRELLAAVGLADRERSLPSRLSGGQQQRVAIARAMVNLPALLLADEPTGNLDSRTGEEVLDVLFDLRAERGTTILLATHDAAVAARCERIVRLRDGAAVEDTSLGAARPGVLLDEINRLR